MFQKLLLLFIVVGTVMGNVCNRDNSGTLAVTGIGYSDAQPDVAKIYLNVQSVKKSATDARKTAASATTDVTTAIGAVPGMSEDSVTTLDVSVQPQYNYPRDGGEPTINGYLFSQRLQVKVVNLTNEMLSAVIDAAVLAGGDNLNIDNIQTELSSALRHEATNSARVEAVVNAMSTAEILAQAAGVTLGQIVSLVDGSTAPSPPPVPMGFDTAMAAKESTPINIGSSEVSSSVSITFTTCAKA